LQSAEDIDTLNLIEKAGAGEHNLKAFLLTIPPRFWTHLGMENGLWVAINRSPTPPTFAPHDLRTLLMPVIQDRQVLVLGWYHGPRLLQSRTMLAQSLSLTNVKMAQRTASFFSSNLVVRKTSAPRFPCQIRSSYPMRLSRMMATRLSWDIPAEGKLLAYRYSREKRAWEEPNHIFGEEGEIIGGRVAVASNGNTIAASGDGIVRVFDHAGGMDTARRTAW
jgi:hypothetical protein